MAGARHLWTGPFGAGLRELAIRSAPTEPGGLWLVPTPLARDQVIEGLWRARRGQVPGDLKVWCWADLWRAVRAGQMDTDVEVPLALSESGTRAVLREAIARAQRSGQLNATRAVADSAGFHRRLRGRVAAWTRQERDPLGDPPAKEGTVGREEWAIFGHYRDLLRRLGAEDAEGLVIGCSIALREEPPPGLRRLDSVVVLDPLTNDRAAWRALDHLRDRAGMVLVTLPWEIDSARPEVFAEVGRLREQFLGWGFLETAFPLESETRPTGLMEVERGLFQVESPHLIKTNNTVGLNLQGAPQGEGIGIALARRVRDLVENGASPEEVLILIRHWDEPAAAVERTLRGWGWPVSGGPGGPMGSDPAIAALLLALKLPADDWETSDLVRLLRNGRVRPNWPEVRDPLALATTASTIREARIFRGQQALREAILRRSVSDDESRGGVDYRRRLQVERAKVALRVFDRLAGVIDLVARPGSWADQVARLRRLAAELRLASPAEASEPPLASLEHLGHALDEQGMVLAGLGRGDEPWSWPAFTREVEILVRDLALPAPEALPGTVKIATVDEAEGARARHILLANLVEGSFPAREAVAFDPVTDEEENAPTVPPSLAREMLRFLRVVGSAGESLTLAYPTTDEKGQELLPAGFLDDVRGLFTTPALVGITAAIDRLDPACLDGPTLSPGDSRVRAVALACLKGNRTELEKLARAPEHRQALQGTAAALRVSEGRFTDKEFGPYDGRLADTDAIRRIAADFGPDRPAFSASQLETLAFCPFQFYQRYVLRLEPIDDRDELDDDRTARGSLIHRVLEELHVYLHEEQIAGSDELAERVKAGISEVIDRVLETEPPPSSPVDAGLRRIEQERLRRAGRRYASQFVRYLAGDGSRTECHRFEATFGQADEANGEGPPGLVLGSDPDAVRLQGKIDRIDLVRLPGAALFRVIDYKSGSSPQPADLQSGLALQLPLYALAVERILMADERAIPLDVGYWALGAKGFRPALKMAKLADDAAKILETWEPFRLRLEAFVLDLVAHLRKGDFPVHPRVEDCTRFCDYRSVCRIAQVRKAEKVWVAAPRMEPTR